MTGNEKNSLKSKSKNSLRYNYKITKIRKNTNKYYDKMEEIEIYRVENKNCSVVSYFYDDESDANAELERLRKLYPNSHFDVKTYPLQRRIQIK